MVAVTPPRPAPASCTPPKTHASREFPGTPVNNAPPAASSTPARAPSFRPGMPAGTTLFDCEQQSECSFSFRKHNKSQAPLLPKRAGSACSVPTACAILLSQKHRATPFPTLDAVRLLPEPGLLPALPLRRKSPSRTSRDHFSRSRPRRALFCSPRAFPRPPHRSLSRPLRVFISFRLAPRAHLPWPRVLPSPALRRRLRPSLHLGFLPRRAPGRCRFRPPPAHPSARRRLRAPRHSEYSRLCRLCPLFCPQRHLSPGESSPAQSSSRRCRLAPPGFGSPRAHEPVERPHQPRLHRRRHRSRFHLGRPSYRPILVLRSQVRRDAARTPALRRVPSALPHHPLARRASLTPKHFQFRSSNFEFHGGESLSFAQPPLFLAALRNANGNRPRRPKSSYRTTRSSRARLLHPRTSAPRCRRASFPRPSRGIPGPLHLQSQRTLRRPAGNVPRMCPGTLFLP